MVEGVVDDDHLQDRHEVEVFADGTQNIYAGLPESYLNAVDPHDVDEIQGDAKVDMLHLTCPRVEGDVLQGSVSEPKTYSTMALTALLMTKFICGLYSRRRLSPN